MQLVETFRPRIFADIRATEGRGRTIREICVTHGIGKDLARRCVDQLIGQRVVAEGFRYRTGIRGRTPAVYVAVEFLERARATSVHRESAA